MLLRSVLAALAVCLLCPSGFSQVAPPPPPTGTRPPQGAAENAALNDAVAIAAAIAAAREAGSEQQVGDGGKTKKALENWNKAREAGRVVIILEPPPGCLAWTWPDQPANPGTGPLAPAGTAGGQAGSYTFGQTSYQFTGVSLASLNGCPCVLAILILHEGARLSQNHSGAQTASNSASVVRDDQSIWKNDILNINALLANNPCAGDPLRTWRPR